jgi:hypothetical protein
MRAPILFACALALLGGCAEDAGGASAELCSVSRSDESHLVVATQLHFMVPDDDGVSVGFDLDDRVSGASDPPSCNRPDYVSPDGTPGIDNQFSVLWDVLVSAVGDAVEGLVQGVINDGSLLLFFRLEGVDDMQNDPCVNVALFKGAGRPDLGTSGFIAPSQTFDVAEGTPFTETAGYIEDGVLHAGPFDTIIPIAIFEVVADLRLHGARLEARIAEDGSLSGTIGGGVEREQIMEVGEMAAENDSNARTLLKGLPLLLDLSTDLDRHEDDRKCHQMSTVMTFESTPAYLYPDAIDPSL